MSDQTYVVTVRGLRYDFEAVLSAAKVIITAVMSALENDRVRGTWDRQGLKGYEDAWRSYKEVADATNDRVVLNLPRLKIGSYLLGQNHLVLNAAMGQFCSGSGELDGAIDPMPCIIVGVREENDEQIGLTLTAEEATAIHKAIVTLDLRVEVGVKVMTKTSRTGGPPEVMGHFVIIGFPPKVFASAMPEQFTMVWHGTTTGGTTPGASPAEA